jgi:hypothetical protein
VISGSPKPLPTRWSKRGFPQQPQVSESKAEEFVFEMVSPVYLLIMPIAYSRHAPSTFDRSTRVLY